ncbi:MAG: hypothetical protein OHK0022_06380 [Roseiflexaceae bacterium]
MHQESIEGFHIAPQQKHLWLLQAGDQTGAYRAHCRVEIGGALDLARLRSAVEQTVQRHEVLRTVFRSISGMAFPLQMIQDTPAFAFLHADLRGLDQHAQAQQIDQLAGGASFDLRNGPVLRVAVATCADQEHVVLLDLHALYADTSTLRLLVAEIGRAYAASGDEPGDELLQYADLAAWQNDNLASDDAAPGKRFWAAHEYAAARLRLPAERRAQDAPFQPQRVSTLLAREQTADLVALAARYGTTAANTLLACWYTLLGRLLAHPSVLIGIAFQGRPYEEMEASPGLFERYLPIEQTFEPRQCFNTLLTGLVAALDEAATWQEYFDHDVLQRGGPSGNAALLSFGFAFEELPAPVRSGDLTLRISQWDARSERFVLRLVATDAPDGLRLAFEYDATRLSEPAVAALAGQFVTLVESICAQPEAALADLNLLSVSERERILVGFNTTAIPDLAAITAVQWFEQQASRTPNHTAVALGDEQWTYTQLDTRANQLAHELRVLGVGPDVLVGLCLERSPAMLAGLLAVWKAGGAYVPLDPGYPPERLAVMLKDARPAVLLTQERLRGRVEGSGVPLICLDSDWPQIAARPQERLEHRVAPEHLAYVIYTSGTTGTPKGVMVTQQGLTNYLHWCARTYPLEAGRGAPVHSSLSFDLTVTSLLTPLLCGGCVTLLPERPAAEALGQALRGGDFSLVKLTPAHLDLLAHDLTPAEAAGGACALVIGGEALSGAQVAFWRNHAPATRLFNEYGPTETVVGCCVYEVAPGDEMLDAIPIGQPIINTQLYLLDERYNPVPVGMVGELYIGGAGVARGYLNRPDLTAERFVPNPFQVSSLKPQASRLYRTGDLARWRPDGTLEYVGRIDHQVKIRGYRIELGEIESVLLQHPLVRDVAVAAREDGGERRLVAYVVPVEERPAGAADPVSILRGFLAERLPEYMVPSAFVTLQALPLTPNGKVDRKALPAPTADRSGSTAPFVAPSTLIERQLAEIWAAVLRVEQVGINDNFFHLGGDSILSIQIVARARRAGIQLAPRDLFQHPTIAQLAAVAGQARSIEAEQGLVEGSVPLTPIQHWFFEQNLAEPHYWNQSLFLETLRPLEPEPLEQALQALLQQHDALRLRFVATPSGGVEQRHAAPDQRPLLRQADLSGVAEEERAAAIQAVAVEAQASLNLADGPLLRAVLFDLGPGLPGRLLLIAHHLVVDGVSWRILLEDLLSAYEQLAQGLPAVFPAKTSSFKRWAELLSEHAQSEQLRREADYWREALPAHAAFLPSDFPASAEALQLVHTRMLAATLDPVATRRLLGASASAGFSVYEALIAALGLAFAQVSRAQPLLLDLEGHGREDLFEQIDLSRTAGWFTTIFPVALAVAAEDHPAEALRLVRRTLAAVPNHGIGYGLLRYLCQDDPAGLRALPQAQVSLNYLGQLDQALDERFFRPARELAGPSRSQSSTRPYAIVINAGVWDGQIQIEWSFSERIHQRATIEQLAQKTLAALTALADPGLSLATEPAPLSAISDEDLSDEDLDNILAQLNRS